VLGDEKVIWRRNSETNWKMITIEFEQGFVKLNPAVFRRVKDPIEDRGMYVTRIKDADERRLFRE